MKASGDVARSTTSPKTGLRLLALLLALAGCGPQGPMGVIPAGPFLGGSAPTPDDWSFTREHLLVALETRGRWLRHTVTVICASHGGALYIPSRHAPRKRWVRNVLRDPRVRVRVGDRVYAGRATRVTQSLPGEPVARVFLLKYFGLEVEHLRTLYEPPAEGDDRAEVWLFRIDPAEPEASP